MLHARVMTRIFARDGFIDRYRGSRLIFPPVLRLLSLYLPKEFPYHKNGKMTEGHMAYWELFPTVDHVVPSSERWARLRRELGMLLHAYKQYQGQLDSRAVAVGASSPRRPTRVGRDGNLVCRSDVQRSERVAQRVCEALVLPPR